jgi:L-aminopeptidase/D-esterase-like protein
VDTFYAKKGYRTTPDKTLYEATGGSGQISVRASKEPLVAAIDVADVAGKNDKARQGQVWKMFTGKVKAEKEATKLREQGLTVNVVAVRPYAGQPGDAVNDSKENAA